jgi:hypothetical protein
VIQWLSPEEEQTLERHSMHVDTRWIIAIAAYVMALLAAHGNGWL